MNLSQESREAFEKENGMTIEAAITHMEKWIEEGNFDSAEAGVAELKKFAPEASEVADLESKLRAKKSGDVEASSQVATEAVEATSNLEDVKKDEKFLAAIGYFGYLCVLPLVLKRDSEFCQYHGKQAVMLAIVFTLLGALSVILPGGFGLISIIHIGISIFAFMQANKGKLWNMPALGDMARKMPF